VVSSARAAGDQWDNPRYRAILLPWMSMIFAWTWLRIREHHPVWFWRWVAVVAGLTLGFTNWYFTRKWSFGIGMSFFTLVEGITGISALILLGGAVYDWIKKRQRNRLREAPHG
jgi:hypothetical protein